MGGEGGEVQGGEERNHKVALKKMEVETKSHSIEGGGRGGSRLSTQLSR